MWKKKLKYRINFNSIQSMQIKAENVLNPFRYQKISERNISEVEPPKY